MGFRDKYFFMKKYLHKEALIWGIGLIILYLFSWQLIHYFYNQQVITQQNRFLIEQAQTLSRISQNQAEKIIQLAPQYVQNENERLTLIDGKTGKILFDTFESQLRADSRKNRPEVKAILDGNETGQAIRESQTLHKEMMYVTLALQSKGQLRYILRLAEPTATFYNQAKSMQRAIFLVFTLMYLMITFFILRVIYKRNQPLQTVVPILEKMLNQPDHTEWILTQDEQSGELFYLINQLNEKLRQTHQAYTQSQVQFAQVLQELTIGIFLIAPDGKLQLMNQAMCEQLGLTESKLNADFTQTITDPKLIQMIYQVQSNHQLLHEELTTFQTKRKLDLSIRSFSDQQQILGMSYDLTKIRHLEKLQKDFVGNVTHELKTPVTSLIGFTETLLDGAMEDPELCRQFLTIMQKDANRLQDLIQEIIQLSKTDELFAYESSQVECTQLVKQILSQYGKNIEHKQLSLTLTSENEVTLLTKKELIQPILKNLIENAIFYAPENGKITIQLKKQAQLFTFKITDNGLGIEAKDQARIFERFYRVDKARARHSGGTGLGLAIVKDYTEKLGGRVWVESHPGLGATFIVELPELTENPS